MPKLLQTSLPDRGILSVTGPDSRDFLQGLISNDIAQVTPERSIYAALLTPQGKYLFDFFISQQADTLLIECEKERLPELFKRLRMYKLRADAVITDETEMRTVTAVWGDGASAACNLSDEAGAAKEIAEGVIFVDPRFSSAGLRLILNNDQAGSVLSDIEASPGTAMDYDIHRLTLGLPDASRDLTPEKSILLESGFDDLNAINWDKGCYMGQELTARTKYRGLVKKRLTPITIEGEAPEPGTQIMNGDKVAGEMRSSNGRYGMALLRLEHIAEDAAELTTELATMRAVKPDWANF